MQVHIWSDSYPDYDERMFAMSQQESIEAAFVAAESLSLVLKD